MYSKVLKVVWIISMLAASATLFYAYAGLQENVVMGWGGLVLDRSGLFYAVLLLMAVFNTSAILVSRLGFHQSVVGWYYGLLATLHLFLITVFIVVAILNSQEKYDFVNLGPMVIGTFLLFIGWLASFFFIRKSDPVSV